MGSANQMYKMNVKQKAATSIFYKNENEIRITVENKNNQKY